MYHTFKTNWFLIWSYQSSSITLPHKGPEARNSADEVGYRRLVYIKLLLLVYLDLVAMVTIFRINSNNESISQTK